MKQRLLWKLIAILAVSTVLIFWLVTELHAVIEKQMSQISDIHQQELREYGKQAEALYLAGDHAELERWLTELEQKENTWVAVINMELEATSAPQGLPAGFVERRTIGHRMEWGVHLHYQQNPLIDIPFSNVSTRLVLRLPQRMRPGQFWLISHILLSYILPLTLMAIIAAYIYRHVMQPLYQLQKATDRFSEGDYSCRTQPGIGKRNDELAALAKSFDHMANQTEQLLTTQRLLLTDLSHELRTPLARINMAVNNEHCQKLQEGQCARIEREAGLMKRLVEDTLTLAWLETANPQLDQEELDLCDLLHSIVEDAQFEYPDKKLNLQQPISALIQASSNMAIGQAVENCIRNALRHTPDDGEVQVRLQAMDNDFVISIADQGPGVPESLLKDIFKPFVRVDKARDRNAGGFGLGLPLAKRHLEAVGGSIQAHNQAEGGLCMTICLPQSRQRSIAVTEQV